MTTPLYEWPYQYDVYTSLLRLDLHRNS